MDFFLGILYPPSHVIRAFSGDPTKETVDNMRDLMRSEEFWDGMVVETDDEVGRAEIGRAAGRLVEVVTSKDPKRWKRLINMLVLGVVGLSDDPFLWVEVDDQEKPENTASWLSIQIHSLVAANSQEARQMFLNDPKVASSVSTTPIMETEVSVVIRRRT